jgi:hypothetical protein
MIIRSKYLRRYAREWCRRCGVQYNRKVWLIRRLSSRERSRAVAG